MSESLTAVPLEKSYFKVPFAHRGLHDCGGSFGCGKTENSFSSFKSAINAGYGIELDLQLSRDGVPIVFHDKSLKRLTNVDKNVSELEFKSLKQLRLPNNDTIPTFDEVLDLVAGQVAVLVELKDHDSFRGLHSGRLESEVAVALRKYNGPIAVMSFNPYSIKEFGLQLPNIPRGLVTEAFEIADWPELDTKTLNNLRSLNEVKEVAASFISHDYNDLDSKFINRISPDVKIFSWTIRNKRALKEALKRSQNITFEGFFP